MRDDDGDGMIDDGTWSLAPIDGATGRRRPEALGLRGMVASAHPVAVFTGLTVLQGGGNAFDATIAVAAAEGVLMPMLPAGWAVTPSCCSTTPGAARWSPSTAAV
ncbi:MAG TPA: hypothetical protein VEQ11_18510 [Chloroflexota bacterium]|nr:hypothetical protein [Chloroflexota bacterium]